jgi:hypothetical protein
MTMPKYVIEREIPGIGEWSAEQVAPSPELIEQHAARGGFPCNRVALVQAVIDPTTAEQ